MAIVCSQEILNFTLGYSSFLRSKAHTPPRTWRAFLLGLDFAIEYPIVFTYLPSVPQNPGRVVSSSLPSPISLIFQVGILLLIENICSMLLPAFGPSQGEEKEFSAAIALSSEFLAPRITLMVGIPLLESILLGSVLMGQLHFGGIVGWLLCRHFCVKSRL